VGFSAGQVQLIDPIKKETSKLFNEEVGLTEFTLAKLAKMGVLWLNINV
jgi:hypothetical protein